MAQTNQSLAEFVREHRRFGIGVLATLALMVGTYFLQAGTQDYMASILNVQKPAPFDGTGLPAAKVPDWAAFGGSAGFKLTADAINANSMIELPIYDPSVFGTQLAAVNWKASKTLVNQLITYPVPYMGKYETGSKEYEGSHLAVDVRMPTGTPIQSVANGRVVKVAESSSGFGKHIVIQHDNVPLADSNETVTLYSSYSHLDSIGVAKDQIVARGDTIGKSGNTGTSTAPHLHFQIDTDAAPWHPWWPFSSAEATAAGLDFFSGVDAGLGQAAAIQNTINPLVWVQAFREGQVQPTQPSQPVPESEVEEEDSSTESPEPEQPTQVVTQPKAVSFAFAGDTFALVGSTARIQIKALDENGKVIENYQPEDRLVLQQEGPADVIPPSLLASDFVKGTAEVELTADQPATIRLGVPDTGAETSVTFVSGVERAARFEITAPNQTLLINTPIEVTIQAVDANGQPTPSSTFLDTLQLSASQGQAEFEPKSLTQDDFVDGKATVKVTAKSEDDIRIQLRGGALSSESDAFRSQLFTDVRANHEYYTAITELKERGIIGGYPDGSFKPEATVNRAEALKILLGGLEIASESNPKLKFPDTANDAWFAPFVAGAVRENIVNGYPDGTFQPGRTVNRAEYLKMLTGAAKGTASRANQEPYDDVSVDAWYAPFAQFAAERNLMPTKNNKLNPSDGMTRGEVAETIYRWLVIKEQRLASYSE